MLVKRGRANKKRKLARETGSVQFMISINPIRLSDLHQLEGDFTKEEVWTVIKVMSMERVRMVSPASSCPAGVSLRAASCRLLAPSQVLILMDLGLPNMLALHSSSRARKLIKCIISDRLV
jgi:hypothetical protein